jgi:hypothetical protein
LIARLKSRRQSDSEDPCIYVIAGPNGAGKSSIVGQALGLRGIRAFNPDEAAKQVRIASSSLSIEQTNSIAWHEGVRLLRRAIDERLDFAFETTLGGLQSPSCWDSQHPLALNLESGLSLSLLSNSISSVFGHEFNEVATTFPLPRFAPATIKAVQI